MEQEVTTVEDLRKFRLLKQYKKVVVVGEKLVQVIPSVPGVYEELCIAYYHTGDKKKSFECLEKIFALRPRDSNVLERAISNKLLYEKEYTEEAWKPSIPPKVPSIAEPVVTLTITTCKRLPLFIKTMESFMRSCVDKHLIKEFICVDDNSSEEDRKVMQEKFPFFKYIFKGPESKGHAKSMQIIAREAVKTPYIFHMEDDWLFLNPISLSDLIEILIDSNKFNVKQVCVNKNYMEVPERRIIGGAEKYTQGNLRYFIHEHVKTEDDRRKFYLKHGRGSSCNYWPHYTLQPSLVVSEIFKEIEFEEVKHFERIFANKYEAKGWRTAFHQEINCRHIGRLIREAGQPGKKNAYELNGVEQF